MGFVGKVFVALKKKTTAMLIFAGILSFATFLFFDPLRDRPGDPGYAAEDFRFGDFNRSTGISKNGRIQIRDVLREIFPPGSDKEYVDAALLKAGCGEPFENQSGDYTYTKYTYANLSGWLIRIKYDEKMKTTSIIYGSKPIY